MGILLDVIVAAILLYFIGSGMKKGGARGVLELLSFVVTAIAVMILKNAVTEFLLSLEPVQNWMETLQTAILEKAGFAENMPAWLSAYENGAASLAGEIVSFVLCAAGFVLTYIVVRLLFRIILGATDILTSLPILKSMNKLVGGVLGGAKGCIVVWLLMCLLFLFAANNLFSAVNSAIADSFLTKALYNNNLLVALFQ